MNKEVWRNNDIQFLEKLSEHKVKCKCGHTMVLIDKNILYATGVVEKYIVARKMNLKIK